MQFNGVCLHLFWDGWSKHMAAEFESRGLGEGQSGFVVGLQNNGTTKLILMEPR